MSEPRAGSRLESLWDEAKASAMSEAERLVYRSNLLGSDLRITNFGGGNTSSKIMEKDPLTGAASEVMWVKGSGGDLGTIKLDGFSTLYMEKLHGLKSIYRGVAFEDEMVGFLPHCTFNLNPRAASIDTPLHAFVPRKFVDHMHPDAIIAIAASKDSKALTQKIFGGEIGWLSWKRPGFELGLWLEKYCLENPKANGVVLESHGLFTWGETPKSCYETTIRIIGRAMEWLEKNTAGKAIFGGESFTSLPPEKRREIARGMMTVIRGQISATEKKAGHFDDSAAVLEFVNSKRLKDLAALGTSCPDHFLRTKIRPLVVSFDPSKPDIGAAIAGLGKDISDYRDGYAAYYNSCKHDDSPAMRDPNAVVYLVPGVGMMTFAKDKSTARISGEFYINAINVMRGASTVSEYQGLPAQEAFDIEYWLLEEAKLQRMPKAKSMEGRVAFITGGAGGIGSATAQRLLGEGCNVMLADIDSKSLDEVVEGFGKRFGKDRIRGVVMDVTKEQAVIDAFDRTLEAFGGLDVLVNNAGITLAANVEDTTLELWNKNMDIMATGYFLVGREGYRIMKRQGIGGSMIFIASKNAIAASPGASAYCTAKAAEVHLARCMALEGAPLGIRVNVVNPDAVLRGSKIWQGEWRQQRAASNKISEDELEEHYRKRSLLQRSVFPEDIAEGVYFFASDLSNKSTGNFLNVDAGNATSFAR
jgi:rhamnulose-1-phosphate aldolase/alcohol dehydrogenase